MTINTLIEKIIDKMNNDHDFLVFMLQPYDKLLTNDEDKQKERKLTRDKLAFIISENEKELKEIFNTLNTLSTFNFKTFQTKITKEYFKKYNNNFEMKLSKLSVKDLRDILNIPSNLTKDQRKFCMMYGHVIAPTTMITYPIFNLKDKEIKTLWIDEYLYKVKFEGFGKLHPIINFDTNKVIRTRLEELRSKELFVIDEVKEICPKLNKYILRWYAINNINKVRTLLGARRMKTWALTYFTLREKSHFQRYLQNQITKFQLMLNTGLMEEAVDIVINLYKNYMNEKDYPTKEKEIYNKIVDVETFRKNKKTVELNNLILAEKPLANYVPKTETKIITPKEEVKPEPEIKEEIITPVEPEETKTNNLFPIEFLSENEKTILASLDTLTLRGIKGFSKKTGLSKSVIKALLENLKQRNLIDFIIRNGAYTNIKVRKENFVKG